MNGLPVELNPSEDSGIVLSYYRGRTIDLSKPVRVYKNLNNGKMSIQQGGKVVCHADVVMLEQIGFKVSESGRQRVILERQKKVHAYAVGMLVGFSLLTTPTGRRISYNPYKVGYFFHKDDESEVIPQSDDRLYCSSAGVYLI